MNIPECELENCWCKREHKEDSDYDWIDELTDDQLDRLAMRLAERTEERIHEEQLAVERSERTYCRACKKRHAPKNGTICGICRKERSHAKEPV